MCIFSKHRLVNPKGYSDIQLYYASYTTISFFISLMLKSNIYNNVNNMRIFVY